MRSSVELESKTSNAIVDLALYNGVLFARICQGEMVVCAREAEEMFNNGVNEMGPTFRT